MTCERRTQTLKQLLTDLAAERDKKKRIQGEDYIGLLGHVTSISYSTFRIVVWVL